MAQQSDEAMSVFTDLSREECHLAQEHSAELLRYGASGVSVSINDEDPNEVIITGPTQEKVNQAAERFTLLCDELNS